METQRKGTPWDTHHPHVCLRLFKIINFNFFDNNIALNANPLIIKYVCIKLNAIKLTFNKVVSRRLRHEEHSNEENDREA